MEGVEIPFCWVWRCGAEIRRRSVFYAGSIQQLRERGSRSLFDERADRGKLVLALQGMRIYQNPDGDYYLEWVTLDPARTFQHSSHAAEWLAAQAERILKQAALFHRAP